jgi:DNA-binding MarR family transcriptional regulator
MSAAEEAAAQFASLFPDAYLRFHRRDGKRSALTQATRAVLQHLSLTGPLTIGEAARHLQRAQSVVSEIIDGLERKALVQRLRDPRDRRRTLVWLTDAAVALLEREREVLSRPLLARAMARMTPGERTALITGMRALLRAEPEAKPTKKEDAHE